MPNEVKIQNPNELLKALGFDSVASYVWVHHVQLYDFPETAYDKIAATSANDWMRLSGEYSLPYISNVTMGWDPSPRTVQSDIFIERGYPWTRR